LLQRGLERAAAGAGGALVLLGEPGIGKTRLAEQLAATAGWRAAWGRGTADPSAPPGWPWTRAVPGVPPDADGFRLLQQVEAGIRAAADAAPLLLVLDDLHLFDEVSLTLARALMPALHDAPVFVVGTSQSEAAGAPTLALGGLDADDVADLVAGLTGELPSAALTAAVTGATNGNPLLVREVSHVLVAEGRAAEDDLGRIGTSPTLRPAIRRHLEPLSAAAIELLEVASVVGQDFDVATIRAAVAGDPAAALHEAAEHGVLRTIRGQTHRAAFKHGLVREVLYAGLGPRRAELHRRVAAALETRFGADPVALGAIAHHLLQGADGGEPARASMLAKAAGDHAAAVGAHERAAELYRRALAALDLAPPDPARRAELVHALGRAEGPTPAAEGHGVLRWDGSLWVIAYGGREIRTRDSRGLAYLARLLRSPGRELHALDLVAAVQGGGSVSGEIDSGPDTQAWQQYRRRLGELQVEIEEAEDRADRGRVELLQREQEALLAELSRAFGLGGRHRPVGSAAERARVSVTKALRAAMKRIDEEHSELGRYFRTTVRTGTYCSYTPSPRYAVRWELG
jgi:hypothetical protein